jgi:alpha-L-rhamnosidase
MIILSILSNMLSMRKKTNSFDFIILILILLIFSRSQSALASTQLDNLMVEYTRTPLGIDVKTPRFSWIMTMPEGERLRRQTAFKIVVSDSNGSAVWNTAKVEDDKSLGIKYAGSPLKSTTRYNWTVTVWDEKGVSSTATSWFETGLMDPNPASAAWEGAQWIGGGSEYLVLYSHYLAVFNLTYTIAIDKGSTHASFIYGANDTRLMDRNTNIYNIQSGRNGNFIKIELDISAVDGSESGRAKINVYRVGYKDTDSPSKPLQSWEILTSVINQVNKNNEHIIAFSSRFGEITLSIDGNDKFAEIREQPGGYGFRKMGGISVNLNPMGTGGDYLTFGMLCDIGFSADPGQKATFKEVIVSNNRLPNAVLFRENLLNPEYKGIFSVHNNDSNSGLTVTNGKYALTGTDKSIFVVSDPSRNSMPMLRTTFKAAEKKIRSARLYATARGIYEVYLNGKRVGDDYYNPGLTQYNLTHFYQSYDVTKLLISGDNALGAMLGEGWWSGLLSYGDIWNHFGDRQSFLATLIIVYEDGAKSIITTNNRDWKYFNLGPVVYGSLDMGEVYDATREASLEGWSTTAFDDSRWDNAVEVNLEGTSFSGKVSERGGAASDLSFNKLSLIGQIGNNAGIFRTLTAQSAKEVRKGVFVYDLGQNIVGVPRVTVSNGHAGQKITLRYSEMLYPDLKEYGNNAGMIMTENYRAALSQDIYTMKNGKQVYQPRFTSHGFRYIEITGLNEPLPAEAVQGVVISSVRQLTAGYESSNSKVNQLWSNLVWSNIDNFLTIPTDCPQRNERMGWSGDISVFSRTATYVSNSDQFLRRHMIAMRDVQSPSGRFTDVAPVGGGFGGVLWGSAGITVPWEVYLQYNDIELLREHYGAMKDYVDYLQTTIDPKTGLSSDGELGDWLGPQNNQLGSAFLVTAYHIYDLWIMMETAKLLGKSEDAVKFKNMYEERKLFFNRQFVNQEHKTLGMISGGSGFDQSSEAPRFKLADTQSSYAVGLALGAFNEENASYMSKNLKETIERENKDDGGVVRPEYSLMTGFIGTACISKALSDHGYSDVAYKLLQNIRYPSWLYSIDQGATTIWERLNGYTVENGFGGNNSMNSFNHYSFGAVGQWLMAYSLGIRRDEPGFRKFILQPEPDPTGEMTWAKGFYDSMYGRINSGWEVKGNSLTFTASVPPNTTATLCLPASSVTDVKENGRSVKKSRGITFIKFESGKAIYHLEPGNYSFSSALR